MRKKRFYRNLSCGVTHVKFEIEVNGRVNLINNVVHKFLNTYPRIAVTLQEITDAVYPAFKTT